MQYTTNYSLKKPQYADEADIEVINDNTDDVDTLIHQNRTMIAPAFDNTKAYVTGDPVEYLGALYVFTSDKAAGAWDASKVEPTTAAEMGGGGASALADLDDVEITSPTQGQALLFDDDDDVWKNQTLPDASVTKEASGNPIEFNDGADAPLVKCVTQITGSQDLHGYDKPWVGGAGKNKWNEDYTGISSDITYRAIYVGNGTFTMSTTTPPQQGAAPLFFLPGNVSSGASTATNGVSLGTTRTIDSIDGYVTVAYRAFSSEYSPENYETQVESGSTATSFAPYSNICPITAYTEGEIEVVGSENLIPDGTNTSNGYVDNSYLANDGSVVSNSNYYISEYFIVVSGKTYTLSDSTHSVNVSAICFYDITKTFISGVSIERTTKNVVIPDNAVYARSTQSKNLSNTIIQFQYGNEITEFVPYSDKSTTHTATFTNSIYQGNADFIGGGSKCDWPVIDLGDLTWYKSGSMFYSEGVTDFKRGTPYNNRYYANAICSHYAYGVNDDPDASTTLYYDSSSSLYRLWVNDPTKSSMTVTDFKTAMSGVQFSYELATPTTETITPTNLPIKSLFGYNHIESSTGDMEIEYITKTYEPLVELIQSSDHIYSTQEQAVGTWIDGKTLYEKTIVKQNISSASSSTVLIQSSELTGMNIVEIGGSYVSRTKKSTYPINAYINSNTIITTWLAEGDIYYWLYWGAADTYDAYITIRYTKSSSNNRSLSKGGGEQEVKEEPTEETKEEPKEETKEENENNEAER